MVLIQPKEFITVCSNDYANMSMHYKAILKVCKMRNFQMKKTICFIFAQNINRGYTVGQPY